MGPAELISHVEGLPLAQAAAVYAANGVPVFPCWPEDKTPMTKRGFHDASSDPAQVAAWWRKTPNANIGLPTGTVSGVDVVDVDHKANGSGFAAYTAARRADLVDGWLVLVRTPSGGMHAYHPANPDAPQPSWQAAGPHVDFRANGGYVIAPPSRVVYPDGSSGVYTFAAGPEGPARFVDGGGLRAFLDPPPARSTSPAFQRSGSVGADADRLAAWVALRGEGERNRGLFWASCRLAEKGLSLHELIDVLGPAGERAGLPPREVTTTIRSAYRATHVSTGTATREPSAPHRSAGRHLAGQVLA
jgi:hypothetical protein